MCAIDQVCTTSTRKLLSDKVEIGKYIELVFHCSIMSKRKRNPRWDDYKEKLSNKRTGKHDEGSCSGSLDYTSQYKGCLQLLRESVRNILASGH